MISRVKPIQFQHKAFEGISPINYWRLVIDLKLQDELGWLYYDVREKGSVKGLLIAFSSMLESLMNKEPLTEALIIKWHGLLLGNVSFSSPVIAGEYHADPVNVGVVLGKNGTKDGMSILFDPEQRPVKFMLLKGRSELDDPSEKNDLRYYIHTVINHSHEIADEMKKIIKNYHKQIKIIDEEKNEPSTKKNKILKVIAECIQNMCLLHPFRDGNTRIFAIITLNRLLLENQLSPVILYDPNRFEGYTTDELVQEIETGMVTFKNIGQLEPSTEVLIKAQCDLPEDSKLEPLHTAIHLRIPKIVELMCSYIKNINIKDAHGKTPLMIAAYYGDNRSITHFLKCKDLNLNMQDQYGYTAAMWAAENNQFATVKLLAEQGIDKKKKSIFGFTLMDILNNSYFQQNKEHSLFKKISCHFVYSTECEDQLSLTIGLNNVREMKNIINMLDYRLFIDVSDKDRIEYLDLYCAIKKIPFNFVAKKCLLFVLKQWIVKVSFLRMPYFGMFKIYLENVSSNLIDDFSNKEEIMDYMQNSQIYQLLELETCSLYKHSSEELPLYRLSKILCKKGFFPTLDLAAKYLIKNPQFNLLLCDSDMTHLLMRTLFIHFDTKEEVINVELQNKYFLACIQYKDLLMLIKIFEDNISLVLKIVSTVLQNNFKLLSEIHEDRMKSKILKKALTKQYGLTDYIGILFSRKKEICKSVNSHERLRFNIAQQPTI